MPAANPFGSRSSGLRCKSQTARCARNCCVSIYGTIEQIGQQIAEGINLADVCAPFLVEQHGDAGIDHLPFVGAQDEILDEIEEFLTGVRHASDFDRVLATVLHVRVDAAMVPSESFDDLHSRLQSFFRKEVELFKGRVVEVGTEMLATFDGPARAIRAACAIRAAAQRLNIRVNTGLYTGECDIIGAGLGGAAVEIARQVTAKSNSGEVLVSSTVKDRVAGSGIQFIERDSHTLSGSLGDWRLFAVARNA